MQRRPDSVSPTLQPYHPHQAAYPVPLAPPMSGVARAGRLLQTFISQSVVMLVVVIVSELFAPTVYKPSVLLGTFSGGHEAAEIKAKQEATAAFQHELQTIAAELARTTAAYQTLFERSNDVMRAAYQMEAVVLQYQQTAVAGAQGVQTFGANLADLACMFAPLVEGEGRATFESGCGVGRQIRQGMAAELAATARDHGAIVPRAVFDDLPDPATLRAQADMALQRAASFGAPSN